MYMPDSTYFGAPAARWAGVPHIVRTRNNLHHWMRPVDRWLGRLYNRLVHYTVTNCEPARQAVLRDERPALASVRVLENGVDLDRFLEIEAPAGRACGSARRVGIVANLRPVKGLDVFLEAARQVAAVIPEATFHIAGEGEGRAALERQAKELGLTSRVEFCGRVSDIPGFLATLNVAVLSSRCEGMSNAILEYMAAGLPVVATAVGAAPQIIEHGIHGWLVPPGDGAALAKGIIVALLDSEAAAARAMAARRRVWQRYSRQAMVQRFERFFGELVFAAQSAGDGRLGEAG
jgi:L-malate glycosyltransferase